MILSRGTHRCFNMTGSRDSGAEILITAQPLKDEIMQVTVLQNYRPVSLPIADSVFAAGLKWAAASLPALAGE